MDEHGLALAFALLNTRDGQRDWLSSQRDALRWLAGDAFVGADAGLRDLLPDIDRLVAGVPITPSDLEAACSVRDALLAWIDGAPLESRAFSVLSIRAAVSPTGPALLPGSRGLCALAEHALIVLHDLHAAGHSDRLRRCQSDDCRWVFFDHSRNRSKVWCDMSGCGSRAKARAYRARRAAAHSR